MREQRRHVLRNVTMMLAIGLLIWAKLRLVADVPRTAIADPPVEQLEDRPANVNEFEGAGDDLDDDLDEETRRRILESDLRLPTTTASLSGPSSD